jgi:hypothetical protein
MANRLHAFKHRDVMRVVKAARAAGVEVGQVTVNPATGAIPVGPAPLGANSIANSWDEVLTGAADEKRPA